MVEASVSHRSRLPSRRVVICCVRSARPLSSALTAAIAMPAPDAAPHAAAAVCIEVGRPSGVQVQIGTV